MPLLNARKVRTDNEILIDLGDDTQIKCRREDMTLLVFEGRIPMPMLVAVQKMLDMPDATPVERIEALGAEHGKMLVDVLREHACKVAIDPVLVMQDDGNPDHLPISYLTTPQMMAIWTQTAVVPQVGQMAAAEFRRGPSADPVDVPPARHDVPPPALTLVTAPAIERIERLVTR